MDYKNYNEVIETANELFNDLSFGYASTWKDKEKTRRIIGFLPMYVPREIFHAAGMLPVGLFGAGDKIPVVRGDAFFQSYICHLPRTVIEMALAGNMDHFDGYIFPAICDVIRNLSGIFKLKFKQKFTRYLDFPQNFDSTIGGKFYRHELKRLINDFRELNGRKVTTEELNNSISLYNRNRQLLYDLDKIRSTQPHLVKAVDFYLVRRAGNVITVEDHNRMLEDIIRFSSELDAPKEDKIRVVVSGAFCEQPPVGLIKTIENAGCYIVDDDLQLGLTWFNKDIPDNTDDPIGALVTAYLNESTASSAIFEGDNPKGEWLAQRTKDRKADGVIFCAPSFCDPALLDRPMLEKAMNRHHIKHTGLQYHENLGQFHVVKEQAGTFSDMIKLWE